jgi:class 3 adenylate cyclase
MSTSLAEPAGLAPPRADAAGASASRLGASAPAGDSRAERLLTAMSVDLSGFAALAARPDPERLPRVLRAYQDAVAGTVARFGGYVAEPVDDRVLAYFGWPEAHEDDAARAVRAALAVVDAAGGLRAPGGEPLAARVGIATGPVAAGDLPGGGEAREKAAAGVIPRLAAGLRALAGPGEVVIAPPPAGWRAGSSSSSRSGGGSSRVSRPRSAPTAWSPSAGRGSSPGRGGAEGRPRWSAAGGSWTCSSSAGGGPGPARARRCCSRAGPGPAGRGWSRRCCRGDPRRRGHRPALPGLAPPHDQRPVAGGPAARAGRRPRGATTRPRPGSTGWRRCSAAPWPTPARRPRSWRRSSAWTGRAVPGPGPDAAAAQGADPPGPGRPARGPGPVRAGHRGGRGPALGRPGDARVARPRRRPAPAPAGAAGRDPPPRAGGAPLDGPTARHASRPRPSARGGSRDGRGGRRVRVGGHIPVRAQRGGPARGPGGLRTPGEAPGPGQAFADAAREDAPPAADPGRALRRPRQVRRLGRPRDDPGRKGAVVRRGGVSGTEGAAEGLPWNGRPRRVRRQPLAAPGAGRRARGGIQTPAEDAPCRRRRGRCGSRTGPWTTRQAADCGASIPRRACCISR